MENKEFLPVYPYSMKEAMRLNEAEQWRASRNENIACRNAIELAIRRDFDGMHLKSDCAESVIAEYGHHRVAHVLAATLQDRDFDGRFSHANKDWAKSAFLPPDTDGRGISLRIEYLVNSHPAVLDGFVNQYRRAYQALGLFDQTHCEPDTASRDFGGRVVVLRPDDLKESALTPESQLWLCTDGFGSRAGAIGREVPAANLADGEQAKLCREDFIGVIREDCLPEWAAEKLAELQEQRQSGTPAPGMGGMEMR